MKSLSWCNTVILNCILIFDLCVFQLSASSTISDIKKGVQKLNKKLYPERQSIRLEPKGKTLKDTDTLSSLNIKNGGKVYVKDLGPQIGWVTVFLAEYAGPLFIYLWFYQRPWIFYGTLSEAPPVPHVVHLAAGCYIFHYTKRILETLFVHRFSHSTMPIMNLFKNCSYYWLFTAYVAYHINHPLYTSPSILQVYVGLASFIVSTNLIFCFLQSCIFAGSHSAPDAFVSFPFIFYH